MKTLAIIPARAGSKRIENKNGKIFCGKPLIEWTLDFAKAFKPFTEIRLSTDSTELADIGKAHGISSLPLRPARLSDDRASSVDVALHELDQVEAEQGSFDAVALLQPTSPYRRQERWHAAFDLLKDKDTDAAIGVGRSRHPAFHSFELQAQNKIRPLFPDMLSKRSQELPHSVYVNGSLYLVRSHILRKKGSFFPEHTKAVLCEEEAENTDIDTPDDWKHAEWLVSRATGIIL